MVDILEGLKIGNFIIKINHRKLLDGLFSVCGGKPKSYIILIVPEDKIRAISSAVDKLDKVSDNNYY